MRRYCLEALTDPDGFRARCRRRYGTEHSHHDQTAREAVAAGTASVGECLTLGHHSRSEHKAYCLTEGWTANA